MNGKIAIIIPAINEEDKIGGILESLVNDPYRNKEIIVVDGGSRDNTLKIAKRYGCTIVHQRERTGLAGARNLGAISAKDAEFVAFFDADTIGISKNYLSGMLRHFRDGRVAAVLPSYGFYPTHTRFERLYQKQALFNYPNHTGPFECRIVSAGVIRRSDFMNSGMVAMVGFGEDIEFSSRFRRYCRENGKRMVFEKKSVFTANFPESLGEFKKSSLWHGRAALNYFLKTRRLDFLKRPAVSLSLASFLYYLPSGNEIALLLSAPFLALLALFVCAAIKKQDPEYIPAFGIKIAQCILFDVGIAQSLFKSGLSRD